MIDATGAPTRPDKRVEITIGTGEATIGDRVVRVPVLALTDLFDGRRITAQLHRGAIDELLALLAAQRPAAPERPLNEVVN